MPICHLKSFRRRTTNSNYFYCYKEDSRHLKMVKKIWSLSISPNILFHDWHFSCHLSGAQKLLRAIAPQPLHCFAQRIAHQDSSYSTKMLFLKWHYHTGIWASLSFLYQICQQVTSFLLREPFRSNKQLCLSNWNSFSLNTVPWMTATLDPRPRPPLLALHWIYRCSQNKRQNTSVINAAWYNIINYKQTSYLYYGSELRPIICELLWTEES